MPHAVSVDVASSPKPSQVETMGSFEELGRDLLVPPSRRAASGHAKKRARNALPAEFLVWSRTDAAEGNMAWGQVTLGGCGMWDPDQHGSEEFQRREHKIWDALQTVVWSISDVKPIAGGPQQLAHEAVKHQGLVGPLHRCEEVRGLIRLLGISGQAHTRCLRLPPKLAHMLMARELPFIVTPAKYCLAAGISQPADYLQDLPPAPARASHTVSEAVQTTTISRNFIDIGSAGSGCVHRRFEVATILTAWMLSQHLTRISAELSEVIALSVRLACPPELADAVQARLKSGELALPGREVMRRASTKINTMDLLYQRSLHASWGFARYLSADSSKQGGHDFFVVLEHRFSFPLGSSAAQRLQTDLRDVAVHRHWPLTTLGLGASGILWKSAAAHHCAALESGSDEYFKKICAEVLSFTSDQGVDMHVASSPLLLHGGLGSFHTDLEKVRRGDILPNAPGSSGLWFLPNCVEVPDALHMLFGSFEEVVTAAEEFKPLEKAYTTIASFMADPDLRKRLMNTPRFRALSEGDKAPVRNWQCGRQFTWKWQYLGRFLFALVAALPILMKEYSADELSGESGAVGRIKATIMTEMEGALLTTHLFGLSLLLLAWSRTLDHEATWYEGCACHQSLLHAPGKSYRQRLLDYRRASSSCCMKGLRIVEMVSGHTDRMLSNLSNVSTPALRRHLDMVGDHERHAILRFSDRLRQRLQVVISMKFRFTKELPYTLFAGAGHLPGIGVLQKSEARRLIREALAERDRLIAAGVGASLHRVAHRLCMGERNPHAVALEAFASGADDDLQPETAVVLRDYGLALVHTRRTEAQHAHIKVAQKKKTWMLPSLLNSALKSIELRASLKTADFWAFCLDNWHRRDLKRKLLFFAVPARERWRLQFVQDKELFGMLYLSDGASKYRDLLPEKEQSKQVSMALFGGSLAGTQGRRHIRLHTGKAAMCQPCRGNLSLRTASRQHRLIVLCAFVRVVRRGSVHQLGLVVALDLM